MRKKPCYALTMFLLLVVLSVGGIFADEYDNTGVYFKDLDHVMIGVSDLTTASETYTRLGFSLYPKTEFSPLGIGNQVIMFPQPLPGVSNLFELMAKLNPDRLDPYMGGILSGPDGIKMMVHMTDEAEQSAAAMSGLGYVVSPVWSLWVEVPGVSFEDSARFRVYAPRRDQLPLPVNGWNLVKSSSAGQSNEWSVNHPNGAVGFDMVTGIISDANFDKTVAVYEKIYGRTAKKIKDKTAYIEINHMTFRIMSKSAFIAAYPCKARDGFQPPPSYVGLRVLVDDLKKTGKYLTDNGFTRIKWKKAIIVPPTQAGGVMFEFVAAKK